ncbi:DUF2809 domain-containing protein [Sphingomonas sp. PL-96]|uniref:ribosomal maturation YjgA family protein n=1 Tax=Sphingomonas sp. PL-96 TaxID=2887201 RepID=UPI001E3AE077|nr:DUF2809 domain-containing protein [Sphingomonas sp. PL-96]MCC2975784.1 DUF2809 domain-containing protein [Sphingomonas sp. PL-96]
MHNCSRRFHAGYAAAALLVFLLEVAIALWVRDRMIRPYLGDSLAVVLVYLTLRAATRLSVPSAIAAALAIAFAIELSQWFRLVNTLGLANNGIARVVLGTGFDLHDFAAYLLGGGLVLIGEAVLRASRRSRARRRRDLRPG